MPLIAIGGAEKKDGDMTVLKTVLSRAKGAKSRVHVITTATNYPKNAEKTYRDAFKRLGIECAVSHIATSAEADDPNLAKKLSKADVIFFSGGDQTKLARILNGSKCLDAVKRRHAKGAVIAGTSAGAAAMSRMMMAGGRPENAMKKGAILTQEGFALKPDVIFDTHFMERGRLPRLFNLVASDPSKIGIGLDEDTAAIIDDAGNIEVVGSGAVTVVNGDRLETNTAPDTQDGKKFKAKGFTVTTLRNGDRFRI